MGRGTKLRSNPALAEAHAAGSKVRILQALAHATYGAVAYGWPRHWALHCRLASGSAAGLTRVQARLLAIEPRNSRIRVVDDELLLQTYAAGNAMVSHAVRAVQHLAEEIERHFKTGLANETPLDRINKAAALFSTRSYNADENYAGLTEIARVRDALEHPQAHTSIATDESSWDRVPLAWMLSNRSGEAWHRFDLWFVGLVRDWDAYLRSRPEAPGTVVVNRGMESMLSVKKAPKVPQRRRVARARRPRR